MEISEETTEETAEEPAQQPKKKPKLWLIILAAIGAVALLGVLVGAIIYGVKNQEPKAVSYTVSDEKALKEKDTVVATVGDMELTNSELQIHYWQAASDFYNTYGYYLDPSVLDFDKPLDQQFYDAETGVTWQQHFLGSALTGWSRYAALYQHAQEQGYTLSADMEEYVQSIPAQLDEMAASYGYANTEEMLAADMSVACDKDAYMSFLRTNIYAGQYMDSIYDTLIPTMEEIEAYYAENEAALNEQGIVNDGSITVDARHILIKPQGGTEDAEGTVTYSDAEWEACRVKAQQILDQWKQESGTEEGFAEFAAEYTEDTGSMSTGGLYTDIYKGRMTAPFEEWCFDESRQYGDTGLVKTVYGYHVMYFVDSRVVWVSSVSDAIIYERSNAIVNEAAAKWPMEVNYKKIILGEVKSETAE